MRRPAIKDPKGTLYAYWSERERDVEFHFPNKPDGHWLHAWFSDARLGSSLRDEESSMGFLKQLEARGYDITTLRFSVRKKPDHPRWAPAETPRKEQA